MFVDVFSHFSDYVYYLQPSGHSIGSTIGQTTDGGNMFSDSSHLDDGRKTDGRTGGQRALATTT